MLVLWNSKTAHKGYNESMNFKVFFQTMKLLMLKCGSCNTML
jgi:hypothetical protein